MSRQTLLARAFNTEPPLNPASLIAATALTTVAALSVSRMLFRPDPKKKVKIIKGPATTLLPDLSPAEKEALPYPPDAFPGARDVDSPYGSTRVYEWGPENGRKVLLVHGITTACLSLGAVAHGLVDRGCRVMLVDVWGRGYTDTPADLDHDERLYTTQLLIAVTSSPLSWAGPSGFSLLGYSLGGGISACFASYYPHLVNSLVLLAPTGLIREERYAEQGRTFALLNLLPQSLMEYAIRKRLQKPIFEDQKPTIDSVDVAEAETQIEDVPVVSVSRAYPDITERAATQWHIYNHAGFMTSFLSAANYGPAAGYQSVWQKLFPINAPGGSSITSLAEIAAPAAPSTTSSSTHSHSHHKNKSKDKDEDDDKKKKKPKKEERRKKLTSSSTSSFSFFSTPSVENVAEDDDKRRKRRKEERKRRDERRRKLLIIVAARDPIIVPTDLHEDLVSLFAGGDEGEGDETGEERFEWRVVDDAAHDFAMTHSADIVKHIAEVWGI